MSSDRSESRARMLLSEYVNAVTARLPGQIEAIILVGSLASGSYVAGPGADVDQITVLRDSSPADTLPVVLGILAEVERRLGSRIPLARSVYHRHELERPFRTDFEPVLENKRLMEVPVELLRIHEHGQAVWGDRDMICRLPIPTREEMIAFHTLTREWSRTVTTANPELARPLRDLPTRFSAQALLVNAFRHYYYATGRSCSDKLAIARRMREDVPGYRFQAALEIATEFKSSLSDPEHRMPPDRVEYMIAQAEMVREWNENRPVEETPLADDRASRSDCVGR